MKKQNSDQNIERELEQDLEIVELHEKLDMSFDLLGLGTTDLLKVTAPKPNTNCGNTLCC